MKNNILFVPVDILDKVTGFIDLYNQAFQHVAAFFADIIRISGYDSFAVIVFARQCGNLTLFVVFDLNFGVYTQSKDTGLGYSCPFLVDGGAAAGQQKGSC